MLSVSKADSAISIIIAFKHFWSLMIRGNILCDAEKFNSRRIAFEEDFSLESYVFSDVIDRGPQTEAARCRPLPNT